jgi:outer membrane immunogenic protein
MLRRVIVSGVALFGLTGLASAADMAFKAPPPVYVSTWTGCYIGGHAGYGRESSSSSINGYEAYDTYLYPSTTAQSFTNQGFAGGGQAGCQFQTGNFLWGLEGDFSSFSNSASKSWGGSSIYREDGSYYYGESNIYNESVSKSSLWSVRARFGIITSEVYHLYATLGVGGEKASATVSGNYHYTYYDDGPSNYCSGYGGEYCGAASATASVNATGLVFGAGAEWKIWPNVFIGAEWLHYALASDVAFPGANCGYYCGNLSTYNLALHSGSSIHFGDADVVRVRASWLFNMFR